MPAVKATYGYIPDYLNNRLIFKGCKKTKEVRARLGWRTQKGKRGRQKKNTGGENGGLLENEKSGAPS